MSRRIHWLSGFLRASCGRRNRLTAGHHLSPQVPTVSVVMVTYNHEKYIAEAVLSIIDQTFRDFELLVIDDGSTDGTGAAVQAIRDLRIHVITQENQGPSAAVNAGLVKARGKYVALMSGDDVCDPQRLERQVSFATSSGAKVICTWIELIDEESKPFQGKPELVQWCNREEPASHTETLRTLFFDGNYLWPSSALVEAESLRSVGGCCLSSLQLSDFMMWIALIKRMPIATLHEPLLRYRIRAGDLNLSHNPTNRKRTDFELVQAYRTFFDNIPEALFREAFSDDLRNPKATGDIAFALEKAFIYSKHSISAVRAIALEKLFVLLQDEASARSAQDHFGLSLPNYYQMTNESS